MKATPLTRVTLVAMLAAAGSLTTGAAASARGPECDPGHVCLYEEPNFGHPHGITAIPVSYLYDCKSYSSFMPVGSVYNNTKFAFELRLIPSGFVMGTAAPYKKYKLIALPTEPKRVVSPGCP